MRIDFHPGQRWISESEPELGLGSILRVSDRTVTTEFKAAAQRREYSRKNAPLRRVRFHVGDTIQTKSAGSVTVKSVVERDGLLFYHSGGRELCETELSDTISFSSPRDRLFAGQLDSPRLFDLRVAALQAQHRRRKSAVRGFVGGRIHLIPHQLYIASEVSRRMTPRVLLADEVGLGKTIEACLILHRLILTGRVQRALILVPESLVHQWFVELLRRFNLWFHIYDEERCEAIEAANPGANPFLEDQLVLSRLGLFTTNEKRVEQALAAAWDMVVVDEAHHLAWSPQTVSREYALVEALGRQSSGLLLLTATPEQLGVASHFARLRLLDPDRFFDFEEFLKEADRYREVAQQAEHIVDREELKELLDQHGTGRVCFRNTRSTITGFPERTARMAPLDADALKHERIDWLVEVLRALEPEKVLLICNTPSKVAAIDASLRQRMKNVQQAVFHEGLTLVQRDRNAAWFAEKNGARLLICSEIGSEGRNFQFAHHLVLFDLPLDPELLEQRIGRLDRIGQTSEIHVHVPFVVGSGQEVLARWYHEGLNAFAKNLSGGLELLEHFGARVHDLVLTFDDEKLLGLIEDTRITHTDIAERLQLGRDRLLELNSFRPDVARELVDEIQRQDNDQTLDEFMLLVFDHYSIPVEELARRTYRLGSAGVLAESFPGLTAEGFSITCDRNRALAREDIQFLTWDHPLVTGALDLLLGSEAGNSSFALWPDAKITGLYLEVVYALECIAPPQHHVDRFLPPTPLRVLVDHEGKEAPFPEAQLISAEPGDLLEEPELREAFIPRMLEQAEAIAGGRVQGIVAKARREMTAQLDAEIHRLQELRRVNRSVRAEEIELLREQLRDLNELIMSARLRLDAIRLIYRGAAG